MQDPTRTLILTVLAACAVAPLASAQCDLETPLLPTAFSTNDGYARSISIEGDVLVTCASGDSTWGIQAGAAYVYERVNGVWQLDVKLFASDKGSYQNFGTAVSIQGGRIAVGAARSTGNEASSGAVYIFERPGATWVETAKLWALDGEGGDRFGEAVALWGSTLVVGAPMDDAFGYTWVGSGYVFQFDGTSWSFEDQIFPTPVNSSSRRFGKSVALEGDLAVVGAPTQGAGTVYVFRDVGSFWNRIQTITESGMYSQAQFGTSLSMSGSRLAIGAPVDHGNANYAGAVRVYDNALGSYALEQKLIASDGGSSDGLGYGLALEDDRLLTGAPYHDVAKGAGYVFTRSGATWTEVEKRLASDGVGGDFYGFAAALSGSTSAIGAVGHSSNKGALYAYDPAPAPTVYCTATVNSLGCTPQIASSGWPSASSASPFTVSATNIVSSELGLFFYGTSGATAKPFLGGLRCVRFPLRRTPALSSGGPGAPRDCTGSFALDFNARIQAGVDPNLLPGTQVTGQFWYRDTGAASGSGLTNAVDFTVCP